jgi:hypothetical protein
MLADSGVITYVPGFWSVNGVRVTSLTLIVAVNDLEYLIDWKLSGVEKER